MRRTPRHVTMDDVAREAGVSRALVSLVMRESPKVSERRRTAVHEAARRLGYRPNAMARSLASSQTRTIGMLLNDLHNPFFAEIAQGVEDVASQFGYRVMIITGARRQRREHALIEALLEHRPDGLLLVSPRVPSAELAQMTAGVPSVVVGRIVRQGDMDSVTGDEAAGARLAVGHLLELGHRSVLHVDGGSGAGAKARRSAFKRVMAEAGLAEHARVLAGDFTEQAGAAAARQLLEAGTLPTAVFAANDLVAIGVIDVLSSAGVRVPEDVSLVGYDDTFIAGLRYLSLTTVNQPRRELGRLAIEQLLRRIDGATERSVRVLQPTLVVRSTTAPPAAH